MFYHKMKSKDFPIKELTKQKTKIDNGFKAKSDQNRMRNLHFKVTYVSNNGISKSMKTPIKRKTRFNMNQSSNKSKKRLKNLNNKARQKLCEATKKRLRVIRENLDEDAKKN